MQTTLLSLLALSAGALAAPAASTSALTCSQKSEGFAWYITRFQYSGSEVFTTPSHQNDNGQVSFNISNPALVPGQASSGCSARSSQIPDYFYGDIVYDCIDPRNDAYTNTTFKYNAPSGLLSIMQTWTCSDAKDPAVFTASGSVNLTLSCGESTYNNNNWTIGQTYSSTTQVCVSPDTPAMAFQISAVA
ncbi:hypothetical protein CMQ_975 [Grosmannia clavigera kw1407]|uniref:AA1-like domain-containing protein n=1 Tax=Grosmannia clavigera (strain kw1407 / UAMH 11150) TaxID=655863 RepID=F0XE28_GROCL|nr:uncharacterized protein CMQ_975 [Grosmannia clavigera kw1407]EFX04047.1 hypothetical protein CMQ_975 [Grosmannia clavigera kw1407]